MAAKKGMRSMSGKSASETEKPCGCEDMVSGSSMMPGSVREMSEGAIAEEAFGEMRAGIPMSMETEGSAAGDTMPGPEGMGAHEGDDGGDEGMPGGGGMGGGGDDGSGGGKDDDVPKRRSCGTMDVHRRLLSQSPEYAQARAAIEDLALLYEKGLRAAARAGIVRIPVVMHVVWNTAQQNVSDAQIQSSFRCRPCVAGLSAQPTRAEARGSCPALGAMSNAYLEK